MSLRPVPQTLYPAKATLAEAVKYIQDQLSQVPPNEVYALVLVYHNTLLKVLQETPHEGTGSNSPPVATGSHTRT